MRLGYFMQKLPSKIHYHQQSKSLELHFGAQVFHLSAEYLRVNSPSAEVRGHGAQQAILQFGKQDVAIKKIEAAGNYALKLLFDDGHDTGIYSWEYLCELGAEQQTRWQHYLAELQAAGKSRDKNTSVVNIIG
jgi:DUF971 family protein